jgi:hypothetical protein
MERALRAIQRETEAGRPQHNGEKGHPTIPGSPSDRAGSLPPRVRDSSVHSQIRGRRKPAGLHVLERAAIPMPVSTSNEACRVWPRKQSMYA